MTAARVPLNELAEVITKGTTPKTLGRPYVSDGIPFLRAENIRGLSINWEDDPLFIDEATDALLARSRILPNDVLVSIAGTIGRVGIVSSNAPRLNCNQAVAIVRPSSRIVPRYLAYWLASSEAQRQMTAAQVTATISNLSLGQIAKLCAPLPPIEEQQRIVALLDKADVIRSKRKEAIALTEELLRSAFLEMVGPGAKSYKDWPIMAIERLAAHTPNAMRTGPFGSDLLHSEFVSEGIAVLGIDNAVQNRFAWEEHRFITRKKYERLQRYTVYPGDVIVTIMGTTGRSAVVPDDIPTAITTKHLATITLARDMAEPEFVSQALFRHPEVLRQITASARGAIMSGLNLGLIKSLRVPVPPIGRQRAFAEAAWRIRSLSDRMELNGDTEMLFQSLVAQAFSGQMMGAEAHADLS